MFALALLLDARRRTPEAGNFLVSLCLEIPRRRQAAGHADPRAYADLAR